MVQTCIYPHICHVSSKRAIFSPALQIRYNFFFFRYNYQKNNINYFFTIFTYTCKKESLHISPINPVRTTLIVHISPFQCHCMFIVVFIQRCINFFFLPTTETSTVVLLPFHFIQQWINCHFPIQPTRRQQSTGITCWPKI